MAVIYADGFLLCPTRHYSVDAIYMSIVNRSTADHKKAATKTLLCLVPPTICIQVQTLLSSHDALILAHPPLGRASYCGCAGHAETRGGCAIAPRGRCILLDVRFHLHGNGRPPISGCGRRCAPLLVVCMANCSIPSLTSTYTSLMFGAQEL